jgi:hypothetical protein
VFRHGFAAAAALFMLSIGVSLAGAAPEGGTGKLAYAQAVASGGDLTLSFDESGQKRFASVDYRLDANLIATFDCGTEQVSFLADPPPTATVTGLVPDGKGHVLGSIVLDVSFSSPLPCITSARFDYTAVQLTNLTSGHVYRMDAISQSFP